MTKLWENIILSVKLKVFLWLAIQVGLQTEVNLNKGNWKENMWGE
jgi:hypothetical protein